MGEILGLTWDCVDISPEAIEDGTACIRVNKELQRVSRDTMNALENKDVILVFPLSSSRTRTVQVLKTPKTETSVRKIFLPKTVAEMLVRWKADQDEVRAALGDEYQDFDLVFASPLGTPTEAGTITKSFHELIEKNDLPKVVFHLDDDRKSNAQLFEEAFYSGANLDPERSSQPEPEAKSSDGISAETVLRLLQNPESLKPLQKACDEGHRYT